MTHSESDRSQQMPQFAIDGNRGGSEIIPDHIGFTDQSQPLSQAVPTEVFSPLSNKKWKGFKLVKPPISSNAHQNEGPQQPVSLKDDIQALALGGLGIDQTAVELSISAEVVAQVRSELRDTDDIPPVSSEVNETIAEDTFLRRVRMLFNEDVSREEIAELLKVKVETIDYTVRLLSRRDASNVFRSIKEGSASGGSLKGRRIRRFYRTPTREVVPVIRKIQDK